MTTQRQIESNRKNAQRSSGPSEAGKARSRFNAIKHGMAGQSADLEEAGLSHSEFDDRRAQWAAELNPIGDVAEFALDRVVAATFRIERCERALNEITTDVQHRAALAWDQDRAVEAATIAARLGKDPVLASRQLQATLAGVTLLIEFWTGLVAMLEGRDWSEIESSKALDLLGVNPDLREGRTLIDAPKGTDSAIFRRALAIEEINRLETLRDKAMIPLDELGCSQAMVGDIAILSKPAKLILRYEREAWKRYWESMKEIKAQAPQPVVVAPTPPPPVVAPPPPRAVAQPVRSESTNRLLAMDLLNDDDDDAWLDAMERKVDRLCALPGSSYVPIAVGVRLPGR